jgi:ADP-ribosylglycohydrolase
MRLDQPIPFEDRLAGAYYGFFIGDALAMPVHWYYNTQTLEKDYGEVSTYMTPKNPHPDSILWRSSYIPANNTVDILHEQSIYWGKRGIHYHQFLEAGENTLNLKLARELLTLIKEHKGYTKKVWLAHLITYMTTPKSDTAEKKALEHLALTHGGPAMASGGKIIARILLDVLDGRKLDTAIHDHYKQQDTGQTQYPFETLFEFPDQMVVGNHFSSACYMDASIPATLYLALKYAQTPEKGLIANTMCGGDNAGRGSVLGALFGAACGINGWPEKWVKGLVQPPPVFSLNPQDNFNIELERK